MATTAPRLIPLLLVAVVLGAASAAFARLDVRTQALTTSYLGSDLATVAGTQFVEIGCLDSGALVACTLKLVDASGDAVEYPIAADNMWTMDLGRQRPAGYLLFNIKAAAGTPTAQIAEY
jgi:hypothetical protein